MVRLSSAFSEIETTCPSIEGSKIVVKSDASGADIKALDNVSKADYLCVSLTKLIVRWNLEDDEGQPLPITKENIDKLPITDQKHLFAQTGIGKQSLELEKKMLNLSTN